MNNLSAILPLNLSTATDWTAFYYAGNYVQMFEQTAGARIEIRADDPSATAEIIPLANGAGFLAGTMADGKPAFNRLYIRWDAQPGASCKLMVGNEKVKYFSPPGITQMTPTNSAGQEYTQSNPLGVRLAPAYHFNTNIPPEYVGNRIIKPGELPGVANSFWGFSPIVSGSSSTQAVCYTVPAGKTALLYQLFAGATCGAFRITIKDELSVVQHYFSGCGSGLAGGQQRASTMNMLELIGVVSLELKQGWTIYVEAISGQTNASVDCVGYIREV